MSDFDDIKSGMEGAIKAASCAHVWEWPLNEDGEPDFRSSRQMSAEPLIHVTCKKCGCRAWFTESMWSAIKDI